MSDSLPHRSLWLEPPSLRGDRFTLRAWRSADLEAIEDAARDPYIPATTSIPAVYSDADALSWVERQRKQWEAGIGYPFAIADAASDAALGFIGLWPKEDGAVVAGYWVRPAARGRGAAVAGLDTLTAWAFRKLRVARVDLFIEPENRASQRVAACAGFTSDGMTHRATRHGITAVFLVYSRAHL